MMFKLKINKGLQIVGMFATSVNTAVCSDETLGMACTEVPTPTVLSVWDLAPREDIEDYMFRLRALIDDKDELAWHIRTACERRARDNQDLLTEINDASDKDIDIKVKEIMNALKGKIETYKYKYLMSDCRQMSLKSKKALCLLYDSGVDIKKLEWARSDFLERLWNALIEEEGHLTVYRFLNTDIYLLKTALINQIPLLGLSFEHVELCDDFAMQLSEALKFNTTLTKLALHGNHLSSTFAKDIGEALKVNSTLMSLSLNWNTIGDPGVASISDALKVNNTVTELCLEGCSIEDSGMVSIGESLKINRTITTLDLCHNSIDVSGVKSLGEALKVNSSLTDLKLDYCGTLLGDNVKKIKEGLYQNESVTKLSLADYGHCPAAPDDSNRECATEIGEVLKINSTLTRLTLPTGIGGDIIADAIELNQVLTDVNFKD